MVVRRWHELLGGDMQFSGQVRGSRDVTRAWFGMLWHLQFGQRFLAFTLRHPCAHVAHPLPVIGTGHFRQVFDVIWRNIHAFALLLHVHAHAAFRILISRRRVCTHSLPVRKAAHTTRRRGFLHRPLALLAPRSSLRCLATPTPIPIAVIITVIVC